MRPSSRPRLVAPRLQPIVVEELAHTGADDGCGEGAEVLHNPAEGLAKDVGLPVAIPEAGEVTGIVRHRLHAIVGKGDAQRLGHDAQN